MAKTLKKKPDPGNPDNTWLFVLHSNTVLCATERKNKGYKTFCHPAGSPWNPGKDPWESLDPSLETQLGLINSLTLVTPRIRAQLRHQSEKERNFRQSLRVSGIFSTSATSEVFRWERERESFQMLKWNQFQAQQQTALRFSVSLTAASLCVH